MALVNGFGHNKFSEERNLNSQNAEFRVFNV
jgi:hypothetical protein